MLRDLLIEVLLDQPSEKRLFRIWREGQQRADAAAGENASFEMEEDQVCCCVEKKMVLDCFFVFHPGSQSASVSTDERCPLPLRRRSAPSWEDRSLCFLVLYLCIVKKPSTNIVVRFVHLLTWRHHTSPLYFLLLTTVDGDGLGIRISEGFSEKNKKIYGISSPVSQTTTIRRGWKDE